MFLYVVPGSQHRLSDSLCFSGKYKAAENHGKLYFRALSENDENTNFLGDNISVPVAILRYLNSFIFHQIFKFLPEMFAQNILTNLLLSKNFL